MAADGLTDQQIANALDIRVSTVNTYWIRIRGKLGQLNRAELIAITIRHSAEESLSELQRENDELRTMLAQKDRTEREAQLRATLLQTALEETGRAVMVASGEGSVVFANHPCERLFGYRNGEMRGRHLRELIPEGTSKAAKPVHGNGAVHARCRDGKEFLASVRVRDASILGDNYYVCTVVPERVG